MTKNKDPFYIASAPAIKKTVRLRAEDVFESVHCMIRDLENKFGRQANPKRVLLGPNQYLLVSEFRRNKVFPFEVWTGGGSFAYPETILGIPCGLKQSDGIEFEFDASMAMILAMGVVSEVTDGD